MISNELDNLDDGLELVDLEHDVFNFFSVFCVSVFSLFISFFQPIMDFVCLNDNTFLSISVNHNSSV